MNLITLLAFDWKADWYKVVVPAVVVILALVGLIFILSKIFKKRKSVAEKTLDDRELVATNSKAMDELIVLAKDNEDIIEELKSLQETMKYLVPSDDSKVIDYDKKIKNLIGDMRIALTKSDGEDSKKTDELLTDLKLAIADRNTKVL